jgi:hypothetical protein
LFAGFRSNARLPAARRCARRRRGKVWRCPFGGVHDARGVGKSRRRAGVSRLSVRPLHFESGRVPRLNSDAASSAIHARKGLASKPSRLAILTFYKKRRRKRRGNPSRSRPSQANGNQVQGRGSQGAGRKAKPRRPASRRTKGCTRAGAASATPTPLSTRKGNSRNVARAPSRRYGGKGRSKGKRAMLPRHPQGVGKGPTGAIAMTPAGLGVDIGPSARPRRSRERDNLRQLAAHQRCLAPRRGTLEPPHQTAIASRAWRSWIPSYGRWYTTT